MSNVISTDEKYIVRRRERDGNKLYSHYSRSIQLDQMSSAKNVRAKVAKSKERGEKNKTKN